MTTKSDTTHNRILMALQRGDETSSNLALITGLNEASVRRSIQQLRQEGYNISFAGNGKLYSLG